MKYILRAAGTIPFRHIQKEGRDQEHRENVPHPVEAEPLTALIADDVTNLRRDRSLWIRNRAPGRGQDFGFGFHAILMVWPDGGKSKEANVRLQRYAWHCGQAEHRGAESNAGAWRIATFKDQA